VPVLFYFFNYLLVIGALLVAIILWRALIVPLWVSPRLASLGPLFVALKFIASPVMCYLIWSRGDLPTAILALIWPLIGPIFVQWVLIIPNAIIGLTSFGKASEIGHVQNRFLTEINFFGTKSQ
jgi:hypothetical protein